jgi:hypothetical protein
MATEKRKLLSGSSYYNPEAVLQAGILQKKVKNDAEHQMIQLPETSADYENFLDQNNDFEQFFQ